MIHFDTFFLRLTICRVGNTLLFLSPPQLVKPFCHAKTGITNLSRLENIINNLFCRLNGGFVPILGQFCLLLLRQTGFAANITRPKKFVDSVFLVRFEIMTHCFLAQYQEIRDGLWLYPASQIINDLDSVCKAVCLWLPAGRFKVPKGQN